MANNSCNINVYTCYRIAVHNTITTMCPNIVYFMHKYGLRVNVSSNNITNLISETKLVLNS